MLTGFQAVCLIGLFSIGKLEVSADLTQFKDVNAHFAANVYAELAKIEGNFVFSPFSLQAIMLPVAIGGFESTRTEILKALNYPIEDTSKIKVVEKDLNRIYKQFIHLQDNFTLTLFNNLYVDADVKLRKKYEKRLRRCFEMVAERKDFSQPNVFSEINTLISNKTNGLLNNVFTSEDINADTKLFLMNLLYFSGSWVTPFSDLLQETFQNFGTTSVLVETMTENMNIMVVESKELNATFLELPYTSSTNYNISMVIVLPDENDGLPQLEKNLSSVLTTRLNSDYRYTVDLYLPKFEVNTTANFRTIFENMGVKTAFSTKANFSGISNSHSLYIDTIKQQTILKVTQQGTEAASVTGVGFSLFFSPKEIRVDHPFLFYIKLNDVIIHCGRVVSL